MAKVPPTKPPRNPIRDGRPKDKGKTKLSGRDLTTRVRTAKRRKGASTRWLQRQLNDPYVIEAQKLGYRSRAAFKLLEIDDQYKFLKPGKRMLDLGAAPGGWSQVAVDRLNVLGEYKGSRGKVVAIDILAFDDILGVTCIEEDFLSKDAPDLLMQAMGGKVDLVVSDMAAPSTGHPGTDHLRIMGLLEEAYDFAKSVLNPDGVFLGKVLQGGTEDSLLLALKKDFKTVRHTKPPSSRADSRESYVIALGYKAKSDE